MGVRKLWAETTELPKIVSHTAVHYMFDCIVMRMGKVDIKRKYFNTYIFNRLTSVFHASVRLLMMNFVITLSE